MPPPLPISLLLMPPPQTNTVDFRLRVTLLFRAAAARCRHIFRALMPFRYGYYDVSLVAVTVHNAHSHYVFLRRYRRLMPFRLRCCRDAATFTRFRHAAIDDYAFAHACRAACHA